MKLSRESRYAVIGLSVLVVKPPGTVLEVSQVAEEAGLPAPFLAKIFGKMTRYGVLTSHRGKTRGYSLAKPPSELTVRQVLEAVDGPDLFERCIFWTETCNDENPCPLHNSWKDLKPLIAQRMTEVTLDKIAVDGNLAAGGDRSPSA